jgi:PAS domain S-box-containing protein
MALSAVTKTGLVASLSMLAGGLLIVALFQLSLEPGVPAAWAENMEPRSPATAQVTSGSVLPGPAAPLWYAVLSAVLLALAASAACAAVAAHFLRPLKDIAIAVRALQNGGYTPLLTSRRTREFARVRAALNALASSIAARGSAIVQLQESDESVQLRHARIVAMLADAVISTDAGGLIEFCNPAGSAMLGYEDGELAGRSILLLFPCAARGNGLSIDRLLEGDCSALIPEGERSAAVICKDGSERQVELAVAEYDHGGRAHYIWLVQDVTEHSRAEAALVEGRAFLSAVIDHIPAAVLVRDAADHRHVWANRAFEDVYGIARDRVIGQRYRDFLGEREASVCEKIDQALIAGRIHARTHQFRLRSTNGELLIQASTVLLRSSDGDPQYLLTIADNKTRDWEASKQLAFQKGRIEAYFQATGAAVIELDARGKLVDANEPLAAAAGRSRESMLGMRYRDLDFVGPDGITAINRIARALAGRHPREAVTFEAGLGDRHFRWKLGASALSEHGRGGVMMVGDDVTDIYLQKQAAERASAAKSRFLTQMSHELRTPLTSIIGYSELLTESAAAAGRDGEVGDLCRIRTAGYHLLGLVNGIIDMSKVESGRVVAEIGSFRVDDLIDEVASVSKPLMEKNRNRFVVQGGGAATFCSDPMKIKQVLLNLAANAAKFTSNGSVEVRYEVSANGAYFEVSDTGIGIPEAAQARIFESYVQADGSTVQQFGGTGLGLAICRRFCELLGGSISVASEVGRGSCFSVYFPRLSPQARADERRAAFG